MRHQSIKLRDQTLVERTSTKEDRILQGHVMMNKIKIKIIERQRKENQLITMKKMKIKKSVDKHHKKKKEKMKTKIIKNRLKAISIKRINKLNYQKT
jgi:hypothetical protein